MRRHLSLLMVCFALWAVRLSGQSPGGVSTNVRLWLKASTGVSVSGSNVTAWTDQSGGTNNATTVNGTNPTLVSSSLNSYPIINFAGAGGLQGAFSTAITSGNVSAFIVTQASAGSANPCGIFSIASSGTVDTASVLSAALFERNTSSISTTRAGSLKGTYNNALALGKYHVLSSIFSSTQDLFYDEGAAATSASYTAAAFGAGVYTIGSRYTGSAGKYLTGQIAEVILYDRQVTAAEQNQIQSYLAVKYGLTLNQTTAQNYTNSAGTVIWNATANGFYKNNIFGVGVDNGSGLSQTSSVGYNTSVLSLNGATGLTSISYLLLSDNGGANTLTGQSNLPNSINADLGVVWRVSQTGTRTAANYVFNSSTTSFGYYAPIAASMTPYMLIDSNADGIYETYIAATSTSGSNITFNTSLPNGALFTFGYKAPIDYGDAWGVPTLMANNGAGHMIVSGVYLGALIDAELDGQPSVNDLGDDTISLADEDGVNFNLGVPTNGMNIVQIGQSNTIQVTASVAGYLNAWIDLNQDNTFGGGSEYAIQNLALVAGVNTVTFNVSDSVMYGATSMRFRFARNLGDVTAPTGLATNGEVEDYKIYITAPLVGACTNGFQNPSFENGLAPSSYIITNESNLPYWRTTAADQDVEVWHSGFNGVPAYNGTYFVELEANLAGALYQDVYTTPGTTMLWHFAHRGRNGNDTCNLKIGPPSAPVQCAVVIDGNTAWGVYQGSYVVPANQYVTRFEFNALGSYGGNTSVGNFLDDVYVSNSFDFGDAPDTYGTLTASNGPRHAMTGVLYLGANESCEGDGQPGPTASLDTYDDGITFPAACSNCNTYTVNISVFNNSGSRATIAGWIDFNKNGVFDNSERAAINVPTSATAQSLTMTFTVTSFSASAATTFARFRVANDSTEVATPYGIATTGEVEDYQVPCVGMPIPVPTSSGSPACIRGPLNLYATGSAPYYSWTGPNSFTSAVQNPVITSLPAADSGTFRVYAVYADGCERDSAITIATRSCYINLTGSVFDDANGNGLIDGTDATTTLGQTVYAVLTDNTNKVLATSLAAANGNYSFANAPAYMSGMNIIPSTSNLSIGSTGTASWPANWVGTKGQYGTNNSAGTGVYAYPNTLPVTTVYTNITGTLLGFDRLPVATAQNHLIPYPTIHSVKAVTTANGMGSLAGSDPEDGTLGSGNTFTITSIAGMNGNQLFYDANGDGILQSYEQITGVTTITNYIPGRLYIRFEGAGSITASFNYGTTDAASQTGTPSTYTVHWVGTLPVKLLYFTAEKGNGNNVLLQWATESETDNSYFEVERSADALHWEAIGRMEGAGTSNTLLNYSMTDNSPLAGDNYYRLRQVDIDGNADYSDIAEVTMGHATESIASLLVHPNPLTQNGILYLSLSNSDELITHITLSSDVGQVIHSEEVQPSQSTRLMGLNVEPGVYLVTVTTGGNSQLTSRVVIK